MPPPERYRPLARPPFGRPPVVPERLSPRAFVVPQKLRASMALAKELQFCQFSWSMTYQDLSPINHDKSASYSKFFLEISLCQDLIFCTNFDIKSQRFCLPLTSRRAPWRFAALVLGDPPEWAHSGWSSDLKTEGLPSEKCEKLDLGGSETMHWKWSLHAPISWSLAETAAAFWITFWAGRTV